MATAIALSPVQVGSKAAEFMKLIREWPGFERFVESTKMYPDCWASFEGYPCIAKWNLATDGDPLFEEALRLLCLKGAVMHLTGDELKSELPASGPVDEMVHAIIAQVSSMFAIHTHTGMPIVHSTDMEAVSFQYYGPYNPGCITDELYATAGWGTPNPRFWLSYDVIQARRAQLGELYKEIGIHNGGRSHDISFAEPTVA